VQRFALNAQIVKKTGVGQESLHVAALQQRLNMIVKPRNKVCRQEERIAPTGPGVLHRRTVTYGNGAVLQKQLHANALSGLAH